MFDQPPPWDEEGKYRLENIRLYYEHVDTETLYPVNVTSTLKSVLSKKT